MKFSKKKAFTLAEVLVTLAVVGIVASMTVPSLMASQAEKEISAKVRVAYSELAQATNLMQAEGKEWDYSISNDSTRHNAAMASFSNYFKIVKTGTTADLMPNGGEYRFYGADTTQTFNGTAPAAYLNNGMVMRLFTWVDCSDSETVFTNSICAYVFFDVNGEKGPNTMGMDLVRFFIVRQSGGLKAVPGGALLVETDDDYCTPGHPSDEDKSLNCTIFHILANEMPK